MVAIAEKTKPAKAATTGENDFAKRKRIAKEIGSAIGQIAHWKVVVGGLLEDVKGTFAKTSEGTKAFVEYAKETTGMSYPSVQRYMQAARVIQRVPAAKKFAGSVETLAFLDSLEDRATLAIAKAAPAGATEQVVRELAAKESELYAGKLATLAATEASKKKTSRAADAKAVEVLAEKNQEAFTALVLACTEKSKTDPEQALQTYGEWIFKNGVNKPLFGRAVERMWTTLRAPVEA